MSQSVTLEDASDTLSYDSKDPLLTSAKPQCRNEHTCTTNIQSYSRKLGEFCSTLTTGICGSELSNKSDMFSGTRLISTVPSGVNKAVQYTVKTPPKSVGKSLSKNKKVGKPFIEHQEDRRTSFSRSSFVTLQERLSDDEVQILSELVRALSLPDDVRNSLRSYLDRQNVNDGADHTASVDISAAAAGDDVATSSSDAKRKQRKKKLKKPSVAVESAVGTAPTAAFCVEETKNRGQLKAQIEHAAKLLGCDRQQLLERATERQRLAKENAYLDKMASFVELCINTGMVSVCS